MKRDWVAMFAFLVFGFGALAACTADSKVKATMDGKPATCDVNQTISRQQDKINWIRCTTDKP